jgi:hypothetical protein
MFRHVVLFRWRDDADQGAVAAALEELRRLPEQVASVRAFHVGIDAGLSDGNYDVAVVADFDNRVGYASYRDDAVHRELVSSHLAPLLADRAAVQHDLSS